MGGGVKLDSGVPLIPLAGGAASRRRLGGPSTSNEPPKARFDYLNFGGEGDSDESKGSEKDVNEQAEAPIARK